MRILVGYPPLHDLRGYLQVGQNRQSKLFSIGEEAAIFPCVMAWAATLLKHDGHDVRWWDAQTDHSWAQGCPPDLQCYLHTLEEWAPDLILWEAKTPSIQATWEAVRTVKDSLPACTVVLCGDHVTALPEETFAHSPTDYVIVGGDYDFSIQAFVNTNGRWPTPTISIGTETKLDSLPLLDRALCRWKDYSNMGNYLYRPGTHGYSARDCWWRHEGGCTFCSWTNTYKNYRQLSVNQFMADVESAHALGAREYFDDAGTWAPPGKWFEDAISQLTHFNRGRPHQTARLSLGCNDRPGSRGADHYRAMSAAGFRFILYGLESANYHTLQLINKGQHAEDMRNAAKWATAAGLQPHLTVMFGYPWETKQAAENTVLFVRELFNHGYANSMQATLLMPYPGTALFRKAQQEGWLLTNDWSRYTMNECILKCPMSHAEVLEKIRECYQAAVTPRYLLKKVLTVRTRDDLRFFWRGFKCWWGQVRDFASRSSVHVLPS